MGQLPAVDPHRQAGVPGRVAESLRGSGSRQDAGSLGKLVVPAVAVRVVRNLPVAVLQVVGIVVVRQGNHRRKAGLVVGPGAGPVRMAGHLGAGKCSVVAQTVPAVARMRVVVPADKDC